MEDNERPYQVLFIGEGAVTDDIRCILPGIELANMEFANTKYERIAYRGKPEQPDPDVDVVVYCRPHQDTLLQAYKRMGIPIIVDMDDDFHAIPEEHPGYNFVGKGDMLYLMKLENCLYLADHLIVTTSELAERLSKYREDSTSVTIIPNGWSSRDPHWLSAKPEHHRDYLIIGWGGTITHREDFQPLIQPIKRIIKEFPETKVCIALDDEIYRYFTTVPEKRKMYLPQVPYKLFPITMSYWDIMLAPLADNHFNRAKSDIKLVDAGAKGIPYIASDHPVYKDWTGGGIKVDGDPDSWYEAMKLLVTNESKRTELGQQGYSLAQTRDFLNLGEKWKDTIEKVILENREEYE